MYNLAPRQNMYVVLLKPEAQIKKRYSLSHFIKSGEVERLHFLFASEKTAEYWIKFAFNFNNGKIFSSEKFHISLYSENRKDFYYDTIKDGDHLVFEQGVLTMK